LGGSGSEKTGKDVGMAAENRLVDAKGDILYNNDDESIFKPEI